MSVMAQGFSKTKPRLTSLSHWPLGNPKTWGFCIMCIGFKELGDENQNVPKVMWVEFVGIHFDHFETVFVPRTSAISQGFGLTPVRVFFVSL